MRLFVSPPSAWRAAPKSISTGLPSARMKMLSGLMSRCRKPVACTAARPSSSGPSQCLQLRFRRLRVELQHGLQRVALLVVHDHVGGGVGLEIAQHAHDVRMAELAQRARLEQEALEAPPVARLVLRRLRDHFAVGRAHGELARQVFLDRDVLVEVGVARAVGDAEAARAQHLLDAVFVQHRLHLRARCGTAARTSQGSNSSSTV